MEKLLRAGEVAVTYIPKFREYGILYGDGGTSYQSIKFCPWCGRKLPESLRDEWYDEIEKLGLEPGDPNLPKEMFSELWYKHRSDQ